MSYLLSILPGNPVLPSGLSIALRVSLQTLDASGRVVDVKDIRGAALSAQSAKGVNVSITPDSYVVQASWAAPATPGGDLPSVTIQAKYQSADGSIMAQGSTTLMVAEADANQEQRPSRACCQWRHAPHHHDECMVGVPAPGHPGRPPALPPQRDVCNPNRGDPRPAPRHRGPLRQPYAAAASASSQASPASS